MKKILSILICCLMMCGISFAEEEAVEPRPYYEMPKVEFEMKDTFALMDSLTSYVSDGYCFAYDDKNKPIIVFIFTLTPLEEENTMMTFLVREAKQNDDALGWASIDYSFYKNDSPGSEKWTDPSLTNGFTIPMEVVNNIPVGESRKICMPFKLNNLEDDVTVDMSYYGVENFTVPIPDDAFLEPAAQ